MVHMIYYNFPLMTPHTNTKEFAHDEISMNY